MINSKTYPSTVTGYNDEYAAVDVTSVAVPLLRSRKFIDPYIMGFMTPDVYPGCYNINVADYNNAHTRLQFNSAMTQKTNIGWGYCDLGSYSNTQTTMLLGIKTDNTLYDSRSNSASSIPLLLNRVKMCNANTTSNGMSVLIRGIIMPIADEPVDDTIIFYSSAGRLVSATVYVNTVKYQNVMDTRDTSDPDKITFSINFNGDSRSFSFSDNDFNQYNIAKLYDSNNEYVIYMTIIGFSFQTTTRLAYSTNSYATTYIQPFYRIPVNGYNTVGLDTRISTMFIPGTFRPSDKRFKLYWDDNTIELYEDSLDARGFLAGYHIGNYPFTIDSDELGSIPGFTYNIQGIIHGRYILDSAGYNSPNYSIYRIYCQNKLADGWYALNLYHKCALQGTSYTTSDYFLYNGKFPVQIFDENNTPTSERVQVVSENEEQYDRLQPWQKLGADITADEFDPDDIPEYVPIGGYDGDGDTILPPALSGIGDLSGFVTMYALKADHLSYFGSQLWASFVSDDFWKSVTTVFSNTTAIDPSVILDYIVSIRLYPFDLSQVSGATSDFAEIFFGRGLSGIFVSADPIGDKLYVLSKCATRVDGGVLYVPEKYGDFRDMEPCAKMVLHVPFAGSCEINPSQVVGKYLSLSYSIDYCTGAFMAQCFVSGDGLPMSYPVATLYGQLGATVQLSASNEMESLQCLAGATLGLATGSMGNIAGAIGTMAGVATSLSNNRTLPHTTGKSAGFSSFYEPRVPYIEILYDKYYVPDNYAHVHGYACNTTSKIGDLHGYTVCRNVDTTGLTCETDERLSIKRILESGFFVD